MPVTCRAVVGLVRIALRAEDRVIWPRQTAFFSFVSTHSTTRQLRARAGVTVATRARLRVAPEPGLEAKTLTVVDMRDSKL
jgi:hypothetical protein